MMTNFRVLPSDQAAAWGEAMIFLNRADMLGVEVAWIACVSSPLYAIKSAKPQKSWRFRVRGLKRSTVSMNQPSRR